MNTQNCLVARHVTKSVCVVSMLYPSVVMMTNTGLIFVRQRDIGSPHSCEQAPTGTTICGIVALFPDERPRDGADGVLLRAMTTRLRHRGPDGARTALEPRFGLGTARLRILDPRSAADLPFVSDDGRVLLAYNGEVTNFRELRARFELDRDGPVDLRLRGLERRWLQKQAMKAHVPTATRRRANMGLEMPHSAWFPGPLRHLAEH